MIHPRKPRSMQTSPEVAILLRDIVNRETGIYFEERWMKVFLEKITPLAEARAGSMIDYYYTLKYDDAGDEWSAVFNALSVQETYFWREMNQIDSLVRRVVPEWFSRTNRPLRIWSAACATGEEPLTIAIALKEAGWGNHPIEIVASDASLSALEKAKAAIYRDRSFRALPLNFKEKYFRPVEKGWQALPELAQKIAYHRINLVSSTEVARFSPSPVIFCRNVFIYFARETIRQTAAHFARGMPEGGHLFVGVSESLVSLTEDFTLEEKDGAFVYMRKERSPE